MSDVVDSTKPCRITIWTRTTTANRPVVKDPHLTIAIENNSINRSLGQRECSFLPFSGRHSSESTSPLEMSSKRHTCRRDLVPVHLRGRRKVIDPRFDEQFGEYDAKEFRQSYQFITDLRREELTVTLDDPRIFLSMTSLFFLARPFENNWRLVKIQKKNRNWKRWSADWWVAMFSWRWRKSPFE